MKKMSLLCSALVMIGGASIAEAAVKNYDVVTTWFEPETQPNDSIFIGSFTFDDVSHTVSNLHGILSESMTGDMDNGYPNDSMIWLTLGYQLASWHDASLGGTFAAAFKNPTASTFSTMWGSDGWTPGEVVYAGFPNVADNPGNAYALIFIPDAPLAQLTSTQLAKLAYADCAPGGMMGATCMTGTSEAGYGLVGSMGGYPASQNITVAVPEPETYALFLTGLGLMGFVARRRKAS
jgi:hypothetical protein